MLQSCEVEDTTAEHTVCRADASENSALDVVTGWLNARTPSWLMTPGGVGGGGPEIRGS